MPLTTNSFTYSGGAQTFTLSLGLGYEAESDISVYVEGELDGEGDQIYRAFTFNSEFVILVTADLDVDDVVVVERTVSQSVRKVDFESGGITTPRNLQLQYDHIFSLIQELLDGRVGLLNPAVDAAAADVSAAAAAVSAAEAAASAGDGITADSTDTLTNKTLQSFTNDIDADGIHIECRNESGSPMEIGDVVYVSGYSVGQDKPLISLADANGSGTMPSIGLCEEALANNATGPVRVAGRFSGLDTSAFSAGDAVYVSETAGELSVRPTVIGSLVQSLGEVLRSHASMGVIEITGAGRVNDSANVADTHILVGDGGGAANSVAMTGDISVTNAGVTAIGAGKVTFTQMASAAIANAAAFLANTASKILDAASIWASAAEVTLSDETNIPVDMDTFINAKVTLTDNRTLANPSNEKVGQTGCIRVIQDAGGTNTLAYGTDYEFANGIAPTLTVTGDAEDLLFYQVLAADRVFISIALDIN